MCGRKCDRVRAHEQCAHGSGREGVNNCVKVLFFPVAVAVDVVVAGMLMVIRWR